MFSERNARRCSECPHTCIITICCQRFWIFIHMARKSPSHGKKNRSSLPHVARKIIYLSCSHGKKNNRLVFLAWQEKLIGLVFLTWQENRPSFFPCLREHQSKFKFKRIGWRRGVKPCVLIPALFRSVSVVIGPSVFFSVYRSFGR